MNTDNLKQLFKRKEKVERELKAFDFLLTAVSNLDKEFKGDYPWEIEFQYAADMKTLTASSIEGSTVIDVIKFIKDKKEIELVRLNEDITKEIKQIAGNN